MSCFDILKRILLGIFLLYSDDFAGLLVSYYGFQQEQEILVSWFFEFLVSWQEMGDKKQEIDFLHFLVNFDQIVGLFDDF